jgi:hypothetical protein
LHGIDVKDTGLLFPAFNLFPFLYNAVMLDDLHCIGKTLVLIDSLNITVNGLEIALAQLLSIMNVLMNG